MSQERFRGHCGNWRPPPSLSPRGERWFPRGRHICAEQNFRKLFENYIWRPLNIDLSNEISLFSNLLTKGIHPVVQHCQAHRSRASLSPKTTQELYRILPSSLRVAEGDSPLAEGVFLSLLPLNLLPLSSSQLPQTRPTTQTLTFSDSSNFWSSVAVSL